MIFDNDKFSKALRKSRGAMASRTVAEITGLDHTVHLRLESGSTPAMDTFCILCTWMKRNPAAFFTSQEKETK